MQNFLSIRSKKNLIIGAICFGALVAASNSSEAAVIFSGTYFSSTATSPSEPFPGIRPAISTANGSGVTFNSLDLATDGQVTHGNAPDNTMWFGGSPGIVGAAFGVQLTIDFGTSYDLSGMRIWNYNEGGGTDAGISLYDLETSLNGTDWTLRQDDQSLAEASGGTTYSGVYTPVTWSDVRYVRFTIVDTYRTIPDDVGGFSEVMFTAVPEPSVSLLLGLGGLTLLYRRHRNRAA